MYIYIQLYTHNIYAQRLGFAQALIRGIPFPNKCQCCCNLEFLWEKPLGHSGI